MSDVRVVYIVAHKQIEKISQFQTHTRLPDYYKIGVATDAQDRLNNMQSATPHQLDLVTTIECDDASAVESALHSLYNHWQHNGEWFFLTYNDINSFKALDKLHYENVRDVMKAKYGGGFDRCVSLYVKIHRARNDEIDLPETMTTQE